MDTAHFDDVMTSLGLLPLLELLPGLLKDWDLCQPGIISL